MRNAGDAGIFFGLSSRQDISRFLREPEKTMLHMFSCKKDAKMFIFNYFYEIIFFQAIDYQKQLQRNIEESLADWEVRVRKLTICEIWGPFLPVATAAASSDEDEATQWK